MQRVQTDRGAEFFGDAFQRALMAERIKFRPIRPYSPHLNGKVERSQRTDWMEFYATVDLQDPALAEQLKTWQQFYNEVRPHGGIGGRTPRARLAEVAGRVPDRAAVARAYEQGEEDLRNRDFAVDRQVWFAYRE